MKSSSSLAYLFALSVPALLAAGCGDDSVVHDMTATLDMNVGKDMAGCAMVATWPSDDTDALGDIQTQAGFDFSTIAIAYRTTGSQLDELDVEVWHKPTTPANPRKVTLAADANYTSCDTCVLVYEDLDDSGAWATAYFARGGTINIAKADTTPAAGSIQVTGSDVHLVEWDIDNDMPVAKGKCYDVGSLSISASYTGSNADGGADM